MYLLYLHTNNDKMCASEADIILTAPQSLPLFRQPKVSLPCCLTLDPMLFNPVHIHSLLL